MNVWSRISDPANFEKPDVHVQLAALIFNLL